MGKVKELLYDEEQGTYKDYDVQEWFKLLKKIDDENSIAAFEAQVEEKENESEGV